MDRPTSHPVPADLSAPLLRAFLAEHDEPCPGCAYNLRALTTDRCPECNELLRLRVTLVEPRLGWFLAAVIGASAGLGLNLLLLVYILITSQIRRRGGPNLLFEYFFWHNLVGALFHGVCVYLLIRLGPRLRRLPLPQRIAIAGAMWALSLINITLFARFVN